MPSRPYPSSDGDDIFDVLGNETRRRILEVLAEEPTYLNELSRELNVSQQAILKHLEYLLAKGLIEPFIVSGEGGTPPKKYYRLAESLSVTEDLARDLLGGKFKIAQPSRRAEHSVTFDAGEFEARLRKAKHLPPDEKIKEIRSVVEDLEETMSRVRELYSTLVTIRREALNSGREALHEKSLSATERRLVFRALSMDDAELDEYFNRLLDEHRVRTEKMLALMREIFD